MIASCANPNCMAEFRYLRRGGRIVAVDVESTDWGAGRPHTRRHFFWLCESCAATFDITIVNGSAVCRANSQFHEER